MEEYVILGAGVTGLAAGCSSGYPIFEAEARPGGICASYYVSPHGKKYNCRPAHEDTYRFEIGGGHWIFGGDAAVLRFIASVVPLKRYTRNSGVFLPKRRLLVPYPIQNHLRYISDSETVASILKEVTDAGMPRGAVTMEDWLMGRFGKTLNDLFFDPFHELYTAGLWKHVEPQDGYKTPVDVSRVIEGAFDSSDPVGYNITFGYPKGGLDVLARRLVDRNTVHFGKRAVRLDVEDKVVHFSDETSVMYRHLISTVPLNKMIEITGLAVREKPDPCTSVLVLNIGAKRGAKCPDEHWLYVPCSRAGFHRVGFYSNVDASFLPRRSRNNLDRVSLYVERSYRSQEEPSEAEMQTYIRETIEELRSWGFIDEVEVADPTWVDVAYTWSWPNSDWVRSALRELESHDIIQVGRYGRWVFQGIADSIRDGLFVGACLREKALRETTLHEPA